MSGHSGELLREFMAAAEKIRPPKFDRAAVHDERVLASFERREGVPSLPGEMSLLPAALLGIPVIFDSAVEVGAIEFRLGDTLYKRVLLGELRA